MNFAVSDTDEEELEPEHTTVLILGRSGTGKTALVRSLLAEFSQYDKAVHIVNDLTKKSKYIHTGWNEALQLRHVALVVEDVIQATPAQFKVLSQILNYKCSHDFIRPCLIVSHALMRQNLYGLLSFFTKIYVTGYKANLNSFRNVLRYFAFDDEEIRTYVARFLANTEAFTHFCLNVEKRTVEKVKFPYAPDTDEGKGGKKGKKKMSLSAKDAMALAKADRYLSVLKNSKEAKAIFELLYCKLNKKFIDARTLDITLQQKSGQKLEISLIEYIACLVDQEKAVPASHECLKFHKYCQTVHSIHLPKHFVLNKSFW